MFGLDRLRALDALARHGTVAAAAASLHLTPSGVSQKLGVLEREAGVPLTEPAGRGLRLTPAGRALAAHAVEILDRVALARTELDRLADDAVGPLRIAAIPTTLHALAPRALARLTAEYPGLHVSITDGEAEETLPAVVAGDLDFALVESWGGSPAPRPAGTRRTVLRDDVVDLVLPTSHPLAGGDPGVPVDLARVDDVAWVADRAGTRTHDWLVATLRGVDVEPRVTCTVCGFWIHVELVAGAGVAALVPRLARPPAPPGVVYRPTRPALGRTIDAVWRRDRETPAVRAAVAVLREVARDAAPGYDGSPRCHTATTLHSADGAVGSSTSSTR